MNVWFAATSIFAQGTATGSGSSSPGSGGSTLMLALRRWYSSVTLSTPDAISGPVWLWAILLGFAGLLGLAMLFQGPVRTLGQLVGIPAHLRLFSAAWDRLRRSGRLVAIVIGTTVVTWTTHQMLTYLAPQGRDDLLLLLKGRRLTSVAIEQGALAGITPLRDIVGLGSVLPFLIAAAVLVFQYSGDRWGSVSRVISPRATRDAFWGTISWGAAALYAVYRTICLVYGSFDLPLGGCLGFEVLVVPMLMPLADGILLAWVVVELRNAGFGDAVQGESIDVAGAVALMPAAAVTCLLMMFGRYLATMTMLAVSYLAIASSTSPITSTVRWLLGWGVVDLQAAGLSAIGLAAPLAWSRGTVGSLFQGYARLLRQEGGHLVGLLIGSALIAGGLSALSYLVVLSLPTQTWVLAAADGYAHYVTLPVGLLTLAGLVELGERSLPVATPTSATIEVDPATEVL